MKLFIGLAIVLDSIGRHWPRGLAGAIRQQLWDTEIRFEQPAHVRHLGHSQDWVQG